MLIPPAMLNLFYLIYGPFGWSKMHLRSITCALTSFFFELSHVIYLKLTRVIQECLLSLNEMNDFFYNFTKKQTIWHLEIWKKLMF